MLSKFTVGGVITDEGRLEPDDLIEFRRMAKDMPIGLRVTITVEEEKDSRSKTHEQVKYWWAVPVPLVADHCGMTEKQTHTAMLCECFGFIDGPLGKPIPAEPSMADLTVAKMSHLIDWMLDWAPGYLEVIVPPPDKNWRQHAETIRRQRRRAA